MPGSGTARPLVLRATSITQSTTTTTTTTTSTTKEKETRQQQQKKTVKREEKRAVGSSSANGNQTLSLSLSHSPTERSDFLSFIRVSSIFDVFFFCWAGVVWGRRPGVPASQRSSHTRANGRRRPFASQSIGGVDSESNNKSNHRTPTSGERREANQREREREREWK